jgi:hypothetical protein
MCDLALSHRVKLSRPLSFEESFPKPKADLGNVKEAIEGDGTAWAYLSASIFAR